MTELLENGYIVLPPPANTNHIALRERILKEMSSAPEFAQAPTNFALGGFCALGLPSSFHIPTVREMRKIAHPYVKKCLHPIGDYFLEQLPDRLLIRPPGRKGCANPVWAAPIEDRSERSELCSRTTSGRSAPID